MQTIMGILITFCVITPSDVSERWWAGYYNKPAIEQSLAEIAARHNLPYRILWIDSPSTSTTWGYFPYDEMRKVGWDYGINPPYVCINRGMGGFAGAWGPEGFALLGAYAFLGLDLGDRLPQGEGYLWNRRSQMGAIDHELSHLLCGDCAEKEDWWRIYNLRKLSAVRNDRVIAEKCVCLVRVIGYYKPL